MKLSFSTEFNNILPKIFSYLDSHNLANCRLICSKWEEVGGIIFSKRKPFFVLHSSSMAQRKITKEFNLKKLKWMGHSLKKPEKEYLFQNLQLSIKEALQYEEIRDFFQQHGHLIKKLRLIKDESHEQLFGIVEDCCSPFHLIHLSLTSWCPNLNSISVILQRQTYLSEVGFPEVYFPPGNYFKENLKLEILSLDLKCIKIPKTYLKELFQNCPNLKILRVMMKHYGDNIFKPDLLDDDGYMTLESLEVSFVEKFEIFLQRITIEKYPRLKTLSFEFKITKELNNINLYALTHPKVSRVNVKTSLHQVSFELLLKMFPHATAISFENQFDFPLFRKLDESFCTSSASTYDDIKELQLDAIINQNLTEIVNFLGKVCPNIERFKFGEICRESRDDWSIKTIVMDILKAMPKLRYFELIVDDYEWILETIERYPNFFCFADKTSGVVPFYTIGTKRSPSRFQ